MRVAEIAGWPIVPREHGAWAVLYGAFIAGVGTAGRVTVPVGLLLVAVTAAAFASGPLGLLLRPAAGPDWRAERTRARCWLLVYGGVFLLAGLPLLAVYGMSFLAVFGMGAACGLLLRAFLVRERADRSLAGELAGVAVLTLVGPAAHAVASARVEPIGALLWLLLTLFFAGGVFYVRMRIRGALALRRGDLPERQAAVRSCFAYHLLLLAGVPLLAALQVVPWAVLLAFAPALWRAAAGLYRPAAPLDVKRLGWSEVAQTAVFLVLLIAALRLVAPPG